MELPAVDLGDGMGFAEQHHLARRHFLHQVGFVDLPSVRGIDPRCGWILECQRVPCRQSSGDPERAGGADQNQSQRIAAPSDCGQFNVAIHFGPLTLPACDGPAAQMQMEIGSDQVDGSHGRIDRRDHSAPALVQGRPPHVNFDFNPGFDRRAQRLKGRIVV